MVLVVEVVVVGVVSTGGVEGTRVVVVVLVVAVVVVGVVSTGVVEVVRKVVDGVVVLVLVVVDLYSHVQHSSVSVS